jgi:hypothetical protein
MTKYKKGYPITCLRQVGKIYSFSGPIYLKNRLVPFGFWQNVQFRTVIGWIKNKSIWEAILEDINVVV